MGGAAARATLLLLLLDTIVGAARMPNVAAVVVDREAIAVLGAIGSPALGSADAIPPLSIAPVTFGDTPDVVGVCPLMPVLMALPMSRG